MHIIETVYEGDLRTRAKHLQSGDVIFTDAPVDNQGQGRNFSPTDLFVASLGSCVLTIMGIVAKRENIDMIGTRVNVSKFMMPQPDRRVGKIIVDFYFPKDNTYSDKDKQRLENCTTLCPVSLSLHPDVDLQFNLNF